MLRSKVKSEDDSPSIARPVKSDRKHSGSLPPQTPPPLGPKRGVESHPVEPQPEFQSGVAEYSVVSQDWIDKKRSAVNKTPASKTGVDETPPALPPRSELADQFDENLYDLPMLPQEIQKVSSSDNTISSSSIAVDNSLYQSAEVNNIKSPLEVKPPASSPLVTKKTVTIFDTSEAEYDVIQNTNDKPPIVRRTNVSSDPSNLISPVEKKTPSNSPLVSPLAAKKVKTVPRPPSSSEVTYDVIAEAHVSKSVTMPASSRHTPSPEYAEVQKKSPVLPHLPTKSPVTPNSPNLSSSREYAYVPVSSSTVKQVDIVEEPTESAYDLPDTARRKELRINSPPSPMLSNYSKLQHRNNTRNDKQEWQCKQLPSSQKKTSKMASADVSECSSEKLKPNAVVNSVDKAIEELEKGLEDSAFTGDHTQPTTAASRKSYPSSGGMLLDWDDSDMKKLPVSTVQQSWITKHKQLLGQRSYEEVNLPSIETNDGASLPVKLGESPPQDGSGNEKIPPGWNKVIGENGVYYWHVKSGKTQWNLPTEMDSSDKVILVCFWSYS